MGENGPVSWDRSEKAARTQGAAHLDPVALEERLKVARALRAEALARRGSDPRPFAVSRPLRAARPSPLPDPVEFAPRLRPAPSCAEPPSAGIPGDASAPAPCPGPNLPAAGPSPATPSARLAADGKRRPRAMRSVPAIMGEPAQSAARRLAPPLAAMLALALGGSLVLSRNLPDAPAGPAPAPLAVAAPRPEASLAPTPALRSRLAAAEAVAAGPVAAAPVAPEPAVPEPPAPKPTAAELAPAAQAATAPNPTPSLAAPAAPPIPAAPLVPPASRVLVHLPSGVANAAVEPALAALRARGVPQVVGQPTSLTIGASTVRFYNPEDAAAAAEIAALVAPHLPGSRAEARDFTAAPSRAAPGNLEIWVAGESAPGAAPTQARTQASGGVPIRRLVESALATAVTRDVTAARDVETGAQRAAREVDAAVQDAIGALQGGP